MALTQFFFETEDFLRFRDACAKAGITAPIHPGVLPVENFGKMLNFAARCRARVPDWMHAAYARADTPEAAHLLSVSIASEQCDALIGEGVEHLHVYTLNNPDLTFDVCQALGYHAAPLALAADGARGGLTPGPASKGYGDSFDVQFMRIACTTHAPGELPRLNR